MTRKELSSFVLLLALLVGAGGSAQEGVNPSHVPQPWGIPPEKPKGHRDQGFVFCRMMYTKVRSELDGHGWSTDFPNADKNLMHRFSELTTAPVEFDYRRNPRYWVVDINNPVDDSLYTCPFLMASDVGTAGFTTEVSRERLRKYLLKGGFLWVDDFWGTLAWEHWATEIGRVLPADEYPIIDLSNAHPMRAGLVIPQISHIGFWRGTGGDTSERGIDSQDVHLRAIFDTGGRIVVLMTHNTDIQDAWERESDPAFFDAFAIDGYLLGVRVLLHAMTH